MGIFLWKKKCVEAQIKVENHCIRVLRVSCDDVLGGESLSAEQSGKLPSKP